MASAARYRLVVAHSAGRSLAEHLPERVATAALEFITGPLLVEPRRVGKPLQRELTGVWSARRGSYRILYEVHDDDSTVRVLHIGHRGQAYGRR